MATSEWTSNPSGVGLYHTLCRRMSAGMDDVHSFDCFAVAPLFVRIAVHKFQGQDGDRTVVFEIGAILVCSISVTPPVFGLRTCKSLKWG